MNKTIIPILIIMLFVSACAHDSVQEEEELDPQHTVIITVPDKIMEEPDTKIQSRASFAMDITSSKMVYKWDKGDEIGVFNVTKNASNNNSVPFGYKSTEGSVSRFYNSDFISSTDYYWVAYAPYDCNMINGERKKVLSYDEINLTYKGQKQLYNATPLGKYPGDEDSGYNQESEALACNQLHNYDYIITAPVKPQDNGEAMHVTFSHVGATVRCYMRFPEGCFGGAGKTGKLTSMSIICKESRLVTDVKLAIKKCTGTTTQPSYEQVGEPTTSNILTLDLPGEDGSGIEVPDNAYFIAYMEFYPVKILDNECFLYLTATTVDGVEKHLRSKPLPKKNMQAGYFYKWSTGDFDEPIELTATLLPWQDIISDGINTDLEK